MNKTAGLVKDKDFLRKAKQLGLPSCKPLLAQYAHQGMKPPISDYYLTPTDVLLWKYLENKVISIQHHPASLIVACTIGFFAWIRPLRPFEPALNLTPPIKCRNNWLKMALI